MIAASLTIRTRSKTVTEELADFWRAQSADARWIVVVMKGLDPTFCYFVQAVAKNGFETVSSPITIPSCMSSDHSVSQSASSAEATIIASYVERP